MNNQFINQIPSSGAVKAINSTLRIGPLVLSLALGGCAALPPADPAPVLHQPGASDFVAVESTLSTQWPQPQWWTLYDDAQLSDLVAQALRNSPNMEIAQARILQANADANGVAARAGANLSADASLTRELYSAHSYYPPPIAGSTLNSGDLGVNFSYDFDFWGRNRAALASALGRSAAAQAEAAGAVASLSAAVASVYFQWQATDSRIGLQDQIEAQRDRLVELEAQRVRTGLSAGDSLTPLQAEAAAPRQTRVQLEAQREQLYFQLKTLVGGVQFPSRLQARPLPTAIEVLSTNLPLDLVARRADIAASRERVKAALHDVDGARAAFYPDVNLSAMIGFSSLDLGQLLHSSSFTHNITPALHLPLFDAGRLRAELDGNRADAALALAQYDQALQSAVGEVNDAAVKLQGAGREQVSLDTQIAARKRDLDSAQRRMQNGLADGRDVARDRLNLLVLDDQELVRRQHAITAQIELIKALGGGYHEVADSTIAKN